MEGMTEIAETPQAGPKTSPYGLLGFGLVFALFGGLMFGMGAPIFGVIVVTLGAAMAQFGIIAAAVELAILRTRER